MRRWAGGCFTYSIVILCIGFSACGGGASVPVANMASPSTSARTSAASQSSTGKSATGLSSLPPDAQGPISAALGKDDSVYWVHRSAKGLRGENPRQALVAVFTREGAEVRSHNLRWRLETRSYGYGDALHPVKAVAPRAKANRVEYRRDGVTEWYENGPLGLEQGFTLAHRPGKANGKALTVELALRGDFVAALEPGGRELAFWGNMVRFNEIKDLLKQRYGTRFKSLTPTDGSLDFLTGDHYFKLQTLSWT